MHLSNSALIPLLLATTASYAQAQSQNTITAVTGCHFHGTAYFCMHDGKEGSVSPAPTATQNAPTQYTACHNHGTQLYCMNGGAEVMYIQPTASADDHGHEEEHSHEEGEEGHDHDHITSSPSGTAASAAAQTTAVTACHFHATDYFCVDGNGVEGSIKPPPSQTENAPAQYTGCHNHGTQKFCMDGSEEVMFVAEGGAESGHGEGEHSHDGEEVAGEDGVSCHYHAGVRHCVDAQGNTVEQPCIAEGIKEPNYRLKVGLLFAILASSTFAVYIPIFIRKYSNFSLDHIVFILMRQFGTGVVISTALIHLLTHANLMLTNKCVGGLSYESTTTAIVMAGAFLAFLIEYTFNRLLKKRQAAIKNKQEHIDSDSNNDEKLQVSGQSTGCEPGIVTEQSDAHAGHIHEHGLIDPQDKLSVMIMEAGIVFHSILIGLTLSVTPDDGVITLFIVILFHQMFEGFAVGSRISWLRNTTFWEMFFMGLVFALITPIGMAIGLGVIRRFNGNNRETLLALGIIDALSAGILLWTGLVEMLAVDWLFGQLSRSKLSTTLMALASLLAGMILMSVLGKWA